MAHYHDALIIWDASKANISNKCIVTEVKKGAGLVTRKNEKTFQLIDNAAQLENLYQEKTDTICGIALHKLVNLDSTHLQISAIDSPVSTTIYNVATGFCLTNDTCLIACNVHEPPTFTLVDNQITIPSRNRVECLVFIYIHPN